VSTSHRSTFVCHNRILAALPPAEYEPLVPDLERVDLPHGRVLIEATLPIAHVYFPESGVVSLVVPLLEGGAVEAGLVGREGLVGLPVALGGSTMSTRAIVQIVGGAVRMPASAFKDAFDHLTTLEHLVLGYTHAFSIQVAQTAACNRVHAASARLCRWLLMCQDRMASPALALTHEFLGQMLGVRRAGVTIAVGELETVGLISQSRARLHILDRARLEAAACECYRVVKEEFDRLPESGAETA
jgi:CRP-like cAMP-binding protein